MLEHPMPAHPKLTMNAKSIPFFIAHLGCIAIFLVPFTWQLLAVCLGFYLLRMFAITIGFHRYFSHRAFKTSRAFQFVLAVGGTMAMQRGPLWWAGHHRHHHRHSDHEPDLHSPMIQGFLWAHFGWVVSGKYDTADYDAIRDFAKYPELMWLDKYYYVPGLAVAAVMLAVGGLPLLVWGFVVSTVILWHITFFINSLCHLMGRRRFATDDDSRNSLILALLTLGEGWHNNHHHYMAAARQGFYWWEIDISYYALRLLALVGIVWDIREVPPHVLERNRLDAPALATEL